MLRLMLRRNVTRHLTYLILRMLSYVTFRMFRMLRILRMLGLTAYDAAAVGESLFIGDRGTILGGKKLARNALGAIASPHITHTSSPSVHL